MTVLQKLWDWLAKKNQNLPEAEGRASTLPEAQAAQRRAEDTQNWIRSKAPEAREVAEQMRQLRESNHFGLRLERAFQLKEDRR